MNQSKLEPLTEDPSEPRLSNSFSEKTNDAFQGLFNRSFELEMLVAGAFIFLLLRLPSYLDLAQDYSLLKATTSTKFIFIIILFLKSITYILLLNLLSHFILRCFWVGVIGVASVSKNEEPTENKNWGIAYQAFKQRSQLPISKLAASLDRFCRMLFGLTFALLIVSIGITIQTTIFLFLATVLQQRLFPSWDTTQVFLMLYALLFIPAVLFSLIDKITTRFSLVPKLFQSALWIRFGSYFFNVSRWMNPFVVVSGPVFGAMYHNVSKKKFITILVGYYLLFIGLLFAMNMQYRSYVFFPEQNSEYGVIYAYYENLRPPEEKFTSPSIQSDVITEKYVKLFVPYRNSDSDSLQKYFPELKRFRDEGFSFDDVPTDFAQLKLTLESFTKFYRVSINSVAVTNASVLFYKHPGSDLPGVMFYIPTDSLPSGRNMIHLERPYSRGQRDYYIPFFK